MKQSLIRKLCAGLLLLLAVGILAGVITTIGRNRDSKGRRDIVVRVERGQELLLYDGSGCCIAKLRGNEEGSCHTGALEYGKYYVAWEGGMGYFTVEQQGLGQIGGKVEETESGVLCISAHAVGSVHISTVAKGNWYTYVLSSPDTVMEQELSCREGEYIACRFSDLPLGKYRLEENGRLLCTVELTGEKPHVCMELP